jgi:hypothetical protein
VSRESFHSQTLSNTNRKAVKRKKEKKRKEKRKSTTA